MKNPTPSQIIDYIGGTNAVAALCDLTKSAVSQWRDNGIPKAWCKYLKQIRPEAFEKVGARKTAKRTA